MLEIIKGLEATKKELTRKGVFDDGFAQGLEDQLNDMWGIVDTTTSNGVSAKWDSKSLLQMNISWVYACSDAIGDDIGQSGFKLLEMNDKGEVEEIVDDPILDLLYKPNNFFTKFDLLKLTSIFLNLTGEAPWYIVKDEAGLPSKIVLLDPANLTLIPSKEGDETDMVDHYEYKVMGTSGYQQIRLEVDEVVFLRDADPNNQFRGRGPLSAIKNTHELDLISEQYNKDFFKNSAQPSMVLSTDKPLTKDVLERLQKEIKEKYEGFKNSHKTLILSNGLKSEKTGVTHVDMQFTEQQKYSRDKILATFRVPPSILGITEDVNRANAEASKYVFAERVIKPKLIRISEQITEFLLPMFNKDGKARNIFLDFEDPVPENKEFVLKSATDGYEKGIMTLNESRAMLNLDPVKDGDGFKQSTSPFSLPAQESKFFNPKRIMNKTLYFKALKLTKKTKKKVMINKEVEKILTDKLASVMYSSLASQMVKKQKKQYVNKKKEVKKELFESKEAKYKFQEKQYNVADQYEVKFIATMANIFADQKKIVLDSIDLMKTNVDPNKATLTKKNQEEAFLKKFEDIYGALIVEQARLSTVLIGSEKGLNKMFGNDVTKVSQFSKVIRNFILGKVIQLANETTETTNDRLKQTLIDGINAQESIPQIKDRIIEIFDTFTKTRANTIARTEVLRATNFASEQAYRESEVVFEKEWLAELDERTDDECAEMDGEVVGVNDKFSTSVGKVAYPPLHPNCRCTLIPVVK